jgi:predicted metalloprotease with PDZ domain
VNYTIKRKYICSQFIQVRLSFICKANKNIHLQLAAWRPGRYELANYAQKLRGFRVSNSKGQNIHWEKINKDNWSFQTFEEGLYHIDYEFYCNQMDAGGSWSDDEQLYLNFTNFAFHVKELEETSINLLVELPENFQVATALKPTGQNSWIASNYQELIDSPFLASKNLSHFNFTSGSANFHLWFNGEIFFNSTQLLETFKAFTANQILAFGEFPAEDYHFIFQLLPHKHYHGVEHKNSTVITFGPVSSLKEKKQLDELIGVSSHELYHCWNVCRIRPKLLLPYDLSKEAYLNLGLVLEGVTTYMGDLNLLQSGYFSLSDYMEILEKQIQKESDNLGWKNQNILESSFDLWLDGYKPGIPEKKVNIYNRGALISLCLDVLLLMEKSSLHALMKSMWENFGRKNLGYELEDFYSLLLNLGNHRKSINEFWNRYVEGKEDLMYPLSVLLKKIGIEIRFNYEGHEALHVFGIRLNDNEEVIQVHPEAKAYGVIMVKDKLLKMSEIQVMGTEKSINIQLERFSRKIEVKIKQKDHKFFPKIQLEEIESNALRNSWRKINI